MHLIMLISKSQLIHQQHVRHSIFCTMSSSAVWKRSLDQTTMNRSKKQVRPSTSISPFKLNHLLPPSVAVDQNTSTHTFGGLTIVPSRPIFRPRLFWRWQLTSMVCRRWWWRLGQNNRLQLWTTTATIMLSFPPPNEIRSSTCYLTGVAPALFLVGGGHCFLVGGVDVSVH